MEDIILQSRSRSFLWPRRLLYVRHYRNTVFSFNRTFNYFNSQPHPKGLTSSEPTQWRAATNKIEARSDCLRIHPWVPIGYIPLADRVEFRQVQTTTSFTPPSTSFLTFYLSLLSQSSLVRITVHFWSELSAEAQIIQLRTEGVTCRTRFPTLPKEVKGHRIRQKSRDHSPLMQRVPTPSSR